MRDQLRREYHYYVFYFRVSAWCSITTERPTCRVLCWSRVWYPGVQSNNPGNNIYFSQINENEKKYGGSVIRNNDPTSDTSLTFYLLDGGVS